MDQQVLATLYYLEEHKGKCTCNTKIAKNPNNCNSIYTWNQT